MNYLNILLLIFLFYLHGCVEDTERGFLDSRESLMVSLKSELGARNIPFRVDYDGYILYPVEYEARVERLIARLDAKRRFKFSDDQLMQRLEKQLIESGVTYNQDDEGYLVYSSQDEVEFDSIVQNVLGRSEVGLSFGGPADNRVLKDILRSEGISFRTEAREHQEWVYWSSAEPGSLESFRKEAEAAMK